MSKLSLVQSDEQSSEKNPSDELSDHNTVINNSNTNNQSVSNESTTSSNINASTSNANASYLTSASSSNELATDTSYEKNNTSATTVSDAGPVRKSRNVKVQNIAPYTIPPRIIRRTVTFANPLTVPAQSSATTSDNTPRFLNSNLSPNKSVLKKNSQPTVGLMDTATCKESMTSSNEILASEDSNENTMLNATESTLVTANTSTAPSTNEGNANDLIADETDISTTTDTPLKTNIEVVLDNENNNISEPASNANIIKSDQFMKSLAASTSKVTPIDNSTTFAKSSTSKKDAHSLLIFPTCSAISSKSKKNSIKYPPLPVMAKRYIKKAFTQPKLPPVLNNIPNNNNIQSSTAGNITSADLYALSKFINEATLCLKKATAIFDKLSAGVNQNGGNMPNSTGATSSAAISNHLKFAEQMNNSKYYKMKQYEANGQYDNQNHDVKFDKDNKYYDDDENDYYDEDYYDDEYDEDYDDEYDDEYYDEDSEYYNDYDKYY